VHAEHRIPMMPVRRADTNLSLTTDPDH
jgi:hypothetical protein